MRLSHADFNALQRAILQLYEPGDLDAFEQGLLRVAHQIIPADYYIWNKYVFTPQPVLASYVESSLHITGDWVADAERLISQHPFTKHFQKTGDPTALKISDFMSQRQVRNSFMWEMQRRVEGRYNLVVTTTPPGSTVASLGFCRNSKDFTERDRLMLNLLRPHIIQGGRIAELLGPRANALDRDGSLQSLAEKFRLSPRECEVAQWVAQGKTNPEIGIILGISTRTTEKHMEKILEKLRVENRTAVAALLANVSSTPRGVC